MGLLCVCSRRADSITNQRVCAVGSRCARFVTALQLGEDFFERDVELDEEDEGVDEQVGDFGDLPLAGFVEGGDDDFERLFADFLAMRAGPAAKSWAE